RASAAGLIVVAAAGNCGVNPATGLPGYAGLTSPGNAPSAITVGAANTFGTAIRGDDRVADYSSRGPTWYDGLAKPDVVAPGHALVSDLAPGSTLPLTYPSLVVASGTQKFLKLGGTSMATGVVSGLVAAILDVNRYAAVQRAKNLYGGRFVSSGAWTPPPYPTANAVKAMLQYTATKLHDANGVVYDALTQGAGEVNGEGALWLAYVIDTSQPVGAQWLTSPVPPSTTFGGTETVAWNQSIIWGTNVATGEALINVNQAAWAQNLVWGDGDVDNNLACGALDEDDNLVWGGSVYPADNIVWGDNIVWADDVVWANRSIWSSNIVWGDAL